MGFQAAKGGGEEGGGRGHALKREKAERGGIPQKLLAVIQASAAFVDSDEGISFIVSPPRNESLLPGLFETQSDYR